MIMSLDKQMAPTSDRPIHMENTYRDGVFI